MGLYHDATFVRRARRALRAADPTMAKIVSAVGSFEPRVVSGTFHGLILSIIHQQLSMKAARTISARVLQLCGRARLSPAAVGGCSDADLRGAGLSRQKVAYVRSVCEHFNNGAVRPQRLPALSDDDVIEQLVTVKGIGVWTAEMILIFNLQRPDVWPIDDLGLRQALRRWYRVPRAAPRTRLLRAGERFRPFRSAATWYLWRSLDNGVAPGFS